MPEMLKNRRGLMMVLSSPSGAGKTTLSHMLLEREKDMGLSISFTTRPARPGEEDGQHYHFVDEAKFAAMVEANEFLEHATVFGHSYGTRRAPVEEAIEAGRDVLFDIDHQGASQLAQQKGPDVVRIFILPPSIEELESPLKEREQDRQDVVSNRVSGAIKEIKRWDGYDFVVINDDLECCFSDIQNILHAERNRRTRQSGLIDFVDSLTEGADD